jgi:hypothetical protein
MILFVVVMSVFFSFDWFDGIITYAECVFLNPQYEHPQCDQLSKGPYWFCLMAYVLLFGSCIVLNAVAFLSVKETWIWWGRILRCRKAELNQIFSEMSNVESEPLLNDKL